MKGDGVSTTRAERDTRVHQVVFRWTDQHLLGGRGIGPVGTSLPEQRDLARWSDLLDNGDLVGPMHPDRPAVGLLRPRSRSGLAVIVRADAVPTSSRGSHQVHALVGAADVLTARLALGLRDWTGWLPPEDGPLPDPQLEALDAAALEAACARPGSADPGEVAALLRHVLHHPDYHFHFAGAASDPYALGHALASLLDVSLMVEGDVQAVTAQPRIAVTVEKTHLRIPPSHWYRKSPASRAPLEEWAEDIAYLVERELAAPRTTPRSPRELLRSLSDLHYQKEGLYWALSHALQGNAKVRRYLTQEDGLHWARQEFADLTPDELEKLCRAWGGWPNAPGQLTEELRGRVAALSLDWQDDPALDSLRDAGRQVFRPAPGASTEERREQLRPVVERIHHLWRDRHRRFLTDCEVLLWHAHQLAHLSSDEVHSLLKVLEVPAADLVVIAHHYTGDAGAREFRRGVLEALQQAPTTLQDRPKTREELRGSDFLLDTLAEVTPERRRALFARLLELGYGPSQEVRDDLQTSEKLGRDLVSVSGHRVFPSLLPVAARHLHTAARLGVWRELRSALTSRETTPLLDGALAYLVDQLIGAQNLDFFREALRLLVDLRRADALPLRELQQKLRKHDYFQEKLHGFGGKDRYGAVGREIILAFADLMWLASGEVPPLDHSRPLPEKKVQELERAERYRDPAYFRLALIRVSRTASARTPASERLWSDFPPEVVESFRDRPELLRLIGEPPRNRDDHARIWEVWPRSSQRSTGAKGEPPSRVLSYRRGAAEVDRDSDYDKELFEDEEPAAAASLRPLGTGGTGSADAAFTDDAWDPEDEPLWEQGAKLRTAEDTASADDEREDEPTPFWKRVTGRWKRRKTEDTAEADPQYSDWRPWLATLAVLAIIAAVAALILYFSARLLDSPANGGPTPDRPGAATPTQSHAPSPSPSTEETSR